MVKSLLILLLGLLVFQKANAQVGKDTAMYFFNKLGFLVFDKDSADYIRFVMPLDKKTGLYQIDEIRPNGQPKLISYSKTRDIIFQRESTCTDYYPNGKKMTTAIYKDGIIAGDRINYYPNGKLYTLETYINDKKFVMTECRDSTGKILAENGNGTWRRYDKLDRVPDYKSITMEGQISNGLQEGEWHGFTDDAGRFVCTYNAGKVISGTGYDKSGKEYPFTQLIAEPKYHGDIKNFYEFCRKRSFILFLTARMVLVEKFL